MKRSDGRMSKKDRRACLAFGVVPVSDARPVTMTINTVNNMTVSLGAVSDTFQRMSATANQASARFVQMQATWSNGQPIIIAPGSFTITTD